MSGNVVSTLVTAISTPMPPKSAPPVEWKTAIHSLAMVNVRVSYCIRLAAMMEVTVVVLAVWNQVMHFE